MIHRDRRAPSARTHSCASLRTDGARHCRARRRHPVLPRTAGSGSRPAPRTARSRRPLRWPRAPAAGT